LISRDWIARERERKEGGGLRTRATESEHALNYIWALLTNYTLTSKKFKMQISRNFQLIVAQKRLLYKKSTPRNKNFKKTINPISCYYYNQKVYLEHQKIYI
jgi:hypothetical protein